MRESELSLRESHHNIEVGVEMKVEQLRMDLSKQIVGQTYLRKENRALAAFLAAMFFVGWILSKVQADAFTVVGLVSALLGAVTLAWQHLQKGERKAKDSIAPPKL
jgi:protein-S-isoprenylcysteine O-methyltransferase Ste14